MDQEQDIEERPRKPRKEYEAPKVEESASFETLALQCGFSEPGFCELTGGIGSS